jgi:hypothetical protein
MFSANRSRVKSLFAGALPRYTSAFFPNQISSTTLFGNHEVRIVYASVGKNLDVRDARIIKLSCYVPPEKIGVSASNP